MTSRFDHPLTDAVYQEFYAKDGAYSARLTSVEGRDVYLEPSWALSGCSKLSGGHAEVWEVHFANVNGLLALYLIHFPGEGGAKVAEVWGESAGRLKWSPLPVKVEV